MKFQKNKPHYESIFLIANGLSLYIKSGISIKKSLELIKVTIKRKEYLNAIERIENSINLGEGIGEAFSKERELFTDNFVDMIIMAEESGRLEDILAILSNHFEKSNKMKKEIKKNLAYPVMLISTMIGVFFLIVIFVIPTLADMYKDMSGELSIFTKAMLFISRIVEKINPVIMILSIISLIVLIFLLLKEIFAGKDLLGRFHIVKNYREMNLILVINMIIKGGLSITGAINKLKSSVKEKHLKFSLNNIDEGLHSGLSLTEAMINTKGISKLSESLLRTGEESGNLEESLGKLSELLEYQLNGRINKAIFYIEPIAILFLGIMVLSLVLMVFIPMYEYMNYV